MSEAFVETGEEWRLLTLTEREILLWIAATGSLSFYPGCSYAWAYEFIPEMVKKGVVSTEEDRCIVTRLTEKGEAQLKQLVAKGFGP